MYASWLYSTPSANDIMQLSLHGLEHIVWLTVVPTAGVTQRQVEESPLFNDWLMRLGNMWAGTVTVNAASAHDGRVQMLQLTVQSQHDLRPQLITLRSETVDVLVIITDGTRRWVVCTTQGRNAVGGLVVANVAGGREWDEPSLAAAERELNEELGFVEGALSVRIRSLTLHPVLASPGITNERVFMLQAIVTVQPSKIDAFLAHLEGKHTGVAEEGEAIILSVVPAHEAREFICHQPPVCAKTLLSLLLAGL